MKSLKNSLSDALNQNGMTLKEFKHALIVYARTCIPEEFKGLIRIPDTSESKYMYLANTDQQETLELIKRKFDRDSVSTQIANNQDLESILPLKAFEFPKADNQRRLWELYDEDEKTLLEEEKIRVQNNVAAALGSKKTSVHKLIQAASKKSFEKGEERKISLESLEKLKTNKAGRERSFFVGGHHWGNEDQLPRFIDKSIWENGHEDKETDVVNSADVGDLVFAKTTWVRAKSEGMLTLRAAGVVMANPKDGHILHVNWFLFPERLDLDTGAQYRRTFQRIGNKFIEEIVGSVLRAYTDFLDIIDKLESGNNHSKLESLIRSKLESNANFWWLNAGDKWTIDDLQVGDTESYGARGAKGKYQNHVRSLEKHDFLIGYQGKPASTIVGLFAITQTIDETDHYHFELLYKFSERTSIAELKILPLFSQSPLNKTLQGSLLKLEPDLFEEIINSTELEIEKREGIQPLGEKNAHVDNDGAYTSKDLLGIENDVRSFALLLATREINPPIAVVLFGKWGFGKSFFMKHLAKRIDDLSKHQSFQKEESQKDVIEGPFCNGIAQIEFNAWSYLDANLWAGLVSSIFEKLHEYIDETTKSGIAKLKVKTGLKERIKSLQSSRQTLGEKKLELKALKIEYKKEKKNTENQIKRNLIKEVLNIADSNGELKNLHDSISKDDRLSSLADHLQIEELQKESGIWRSFWVNIRKERGWRKYLLAAVLSMLLIPLIYYWLLPILGDYSWGGTITPLLAYLGIDIKKLVKRYKLVRSFAEKFNEQIEQNSELKEKVDSYKKSAKELKHHIEFADEEIKKIDDKIDSEEYKLEYQLSEEAFRDVVKERTNHKDYHKHLGIVSVIRKDLELLSDLFYEMNDQESTKQDDRNSHLDGGKDFLKDQFLPGRKLDRIILYIDDLDRCSDEKVLEVIQAVHLLMAFPLFNVVVGVDPKCVRNALLLKTQLEYLKVAPLEKIKELGVEMITPGEYLEKIFQIPFELKDPDEDSVSELVGDLLEGQIDYNLEQEHERSQKSDPDDEKKNSDDGKTDQDNKSSLLDKMMQEVNQQKQHLLVSIAPENLKLAPSESERLKSMVFLVGNTPRTIKRFINIYRIIRAAKRPEKETDLSPKDQLAIMFLLAIGIGNHKDKKNDLFNLIEKEPTKHLSDYIKDFNDLIQYERKIMEQENIRDLLNLKGEFLLIHLALVGRFSFGREKSILEREATKS